MISGVIEHLVAFGSLEHLASKYGAFGCAEVLCVSLKRLTGNVRHEELICVGQEMKEARQKGAQDSTVLIKVER